MEIIIIILGFWMHNFEMSIKFLENIQIPRCNSASNYSVLSLLYVHLSDVFELREYFLQNAQHFESNTALCKVCTQDSSYIVRYNCFSASPLLPLLYPGLSC